MAVIWSLIGIFPRPPAAGLQNVGQFDQAVFTARDADKCLLICSNSPRAAFNFSVTHKRIHTNQNDEAFYRALHVQ